LEKAFANNIGHYFLLVTGKTLTKFRKTSTACYCKKSAEDDYTVTLPVCSKAKEFWNKR